LQKKEKSQLLPLAVALTIAVAGATVFTAWVYLYSCPIFQSSQCEDLTNWQTLVLEGIVLAGGLGSYFYYLQRKNSQKIEDVISKIDEGEKKRKQFWAQVAYSNLFMIIASHKAVIIHYKNLLKDGISTESLDKIAHFLQEAKAAVEGAYIPRLDKALSNMADLLDDRALYNDITVMNYFEFKSSFNMPVITDRNDSHLAQLEPIMKDSVGGKIPIIEELIATFEQYLNRIKTEMPNKDL
jgi:hypothetical protein